MPRALISVSDKSGVVEFARRLAGLGWEILSTGGTAKTLRQGGLAPKDVSDVTGFPEILDGRVKTLHPAVHGALLARRDLPQHLATIAAHNIQPIDLVAVNLYPFRETAARQGIEPRDVVEQIDIGGPAMLRSGAKNFKSVFVIVDPDDYPRVIASIEAGDTDLDLKRLLAQKVYEHTASYDSAIATWFAEERQELFPNTFTAAFTRSLLLRYGENPGQAAAFYSERPGYGLAGLQQRGGKELSFNNLLDLEGALLAIEPFGAQPACAIVKHTTPCGLAVAESVADAYRKALSCDPVSAFGSVIAFNKPVDETTADAVSGLFVEVVVAPEFDDAAVEILGRKKNLRVLEGVATWPPRSFDYKRVRGGVLVQERAPTVIDTNGWDAPTKRKPTEQELEDLLFAWRAVAAVKSNAIVLARGGMTIGIGAGQMSRVDAAYMAVHKAKQAGHETKGAVIGSDAFFPFRDGVDQAAQAGVTAIVQPGGSVRDAEVVTAADEHDIAMVFTGKRQFRH
jgi:phosphoribosylaminoimidazolecarboxamide formyltransferase / IMP cyclohydrolase